MSKFGDWFSDHGDEIVLYGLLYSLIGFVASIPIGAFVANNNFKKAEKFLESKNKELGEVVCDVTGIENFNPSSMTLKFDNNRYSVELFGSVERESQNDILKDYTNINFNISETSAQALIEAVNKRKDFDKKVIKISSNFGTSVSTGVKDNLGFYGKVKLKKIM